MEIIILFWFIFAVMSATIAYSKNRNWFGWGLLGFIIGIFAVIWVACLPSLEEEGL